jgi:molybdate transport system substrate-binding protein
MRFIAAVLCLALGPFGALPGAAQTRDVLVFAAASLKNALDEINAQYNAQYKASAGRGAEVSYAASSALARQIAAAAPADVFISADLDWMDYLEQRKLIRPESRTNLLSNRLVLIAAADSRLATIIAPGFPLVQLLGDGRLAMGDPVAVPAGKYGKAALEKLDAWAAVERKLARTENVRAALLLVARGEAPLGVVYQTDAAAEPKVRVVGTFPADTHPPIVYPIGVVASSTQPDAARYVTYLKSAAARPLFEKQGFTVFTE